MATEEPLNPAKQANDRGFFIYGGSAVNTAHGHAVRIQESSAGGSPHCWMFVGASSAIGGFDPHLSLADAIEIRDRLNQFIDGVSERWSEGSRMLEEARAEVNRRRTAERKDEGTC